MSDQTPHVLTRPRQETCRGRSVWDEESAVWKTEFEYGEVRPEPPDSLGEQINRRFGIGPRQSRVVLGDVDLLFDPAHRLLLIETRTTPGRWQRAGLPGLPLDLENVWADFQVGWDENQVAFLDLPVHIVWDSTGRRVDCRFTPQPEPVR